MGRPILDVDNEGNVMRMFAHAGETTAWMRCFERAVASGKHAVDAANIADDYLKAIEDRIPEEGKLAMASAIGKAH